MQASGGAGRFLDAPLQRPLDQIGALKELGTMVRKAFADSHATAAPDMGERQGHWQQQLEVPVPGETDPLTLLVRGARLGRWDGHHVRNREGRLVPLALCLGSTAVGLAILLFGHAPRDVIALDVAMLVTLFA